MKTITSAIALAALLGAFSLNAFAADAACKRGTVLDEETGKCVKITKGSH